MDNISVCQITSGHSLDDERILHRFAVSAARMGYESCVVGPSAGSEETRDGVRLIPCPQLKGRLTWTRRILGLFSILYWCLKNQADIYQIHDPDLLPIGLVLRMAGRNVVYDVHDDYEESIRTKFYGNPLLVSWLPALWWRFELFISKRFRAVFVADRHLAKKFDKTAPVVFGNYPFLDFTKPSKGSEKPKFKIIYVGGVSKVRGLEVLAKALSLMDNEHITVDVIGPCYDDNLLKTLKNDSRIRLHGKIDWRELGDFYTQADLGVALYQPIPSFMYSPGENSVKIIEYMAGGIPVLTSNFKGLQTFVESQGVGLTVDPTDPRQIADKLDYLINNREQSKALGEKGRALFEDVYNWNVYEDNLKASYSNIVTPV